MDRDFWAALGLTTLASVMLLGAGWAMVLFFTGVEYSDELTEMAVVTDTGYAPARHSSGTGVGLMTNGEMGVVSTSNYTPEQYHTVFKCQHGKFVIDRQSVWAVVQPGDTVTVHYREKFKKYFHAGRFAGYDFLHVERNY